MRVVKIEAAIIAVLAAVAVTQQVWIQTRPEPVAVFDYPTQRVLNGPVPAGAAVRVRGTKCSRADRDLPVLTVRTWVTVDPPGTIVVEGQTQGTRRRGCVTRMFVNPAPDKVTQATLAMFSPSLPCVSWRITGRDVPTDPHFLPAVWTTEPFDICP